MAMPTITAEAGTPVKLTVDLQSRHIAAWRIFTRSSEADDWTFIKSGHEDATTVLHEAPPGGGLRAEFIFTPDAEREFRALLVFEQRNEILEDGAVPVVAPGDQLIVVQEVTFA